MKQLIINAIIEAGVTLTLIAFLCVVLLWAEVMAVWH